MVSLPTPAGVLAASSLLRPLVVRTPLLESKLVNESVLGGEGRRLLVKAECLQTTNSFKYRGALHRLLRLLEDDREAADRGVVAFSSGNFGQALAAAATSLGVTCAIVSPHDAPRVKLDRIKSFGAKLHLSEAPEGTNREVAASGMAKSISDEFGMTLLHPFEDIDVVHGQGTVGVELLEQAKEMLQTNESQLESIVVPCGGGGLTAGVNLSVESMVSKPNVVTVEPAGYDDHARSFLSEGRQRLSLTELYTIPHPQRSIACDALMAGAPGKITWSINGPRLSDAVASSGDGSVIRAMEFAFEHFRLVLEPSGALGLAAVLDGQVEVNPGKAVAVIASGGNIDMRTYAGLMGCLAENQ